jgi:hypothetical protein
MHYTFYDLQLAKNREYQVRGNNIRNAEKKASCFDQTIPNHGPTGLLNTVVVYKTIIDSRISRRLLDVDGTASGTMPARTGRESFNDLNVVQVLPSKYHRYSNSLEYD